LQVAWRMWRRNHLFLPREFDMNPRVTLVRKNLFVESLCAWSPNKWHLKNRVATIKAVFWRHCYACESKLSRCRGRRRFFTFVSLSFTLDFAIVFIFSSFFLLLS
jgi:hypothetical protein